MSELLAWAMISDYSYLVDLSFKDAKICPNLNDLLQFY